jgi:hypothetical protein
LTWLRDGLSMFGRSRSRTSFDSIPTSGNIGRVTFSLNPANPLPDQLRSDTDPVQLEDGNDTAPASEAQTTCAW